MGTGKDSAEPPSVASRVLFRTGHGLRTGTLSIADALNIMQTGGFALVLAAVATPNLLPSPGIPLGIILGVPLLILAVQYAAGASQPRFPPRLLNDRRLAAVFGRALRWLAPRVRWWERRVKRRPLACPESGKRWLGGGWVGLMAILIILPVPLGNSLPALSALLIGIGLFADDRLTVGLGLAAGLAGLAYAAAVAFGALHLATLAFP